MRTVLVWVLAALALGSGDLTRGSVPTEITPAPADTLEDFNLPDHFRQLISDRTRIDLYQHSHYRIEQGVTPLAPSYIVLRNPNPKYVRSILPEYAPAILEYRRSLPDDLVPLRSYRAAILDRASDLADVVFPAGDLTRAQMAAAELIARRLAHDGLLLTLARVIDLLDPDQFLRDPKEGVAALQRIGFPTDFLACFPVANVPGEAGIAVWIARTLRSGIDPEALKSDLAGFPFKYVPASQFVASTESGETQLGLLRMQAHGGYRNGIIPGGSIDVIDQAVAALPDVDSIITLPGERMKPFQGLTRAWPLTRTNQITLIGEPFAAGAWAQDNGKAGHVLDNHGRLVLATLTPRYACQNEGRSTLKKAESFVMDGLRAAGHQVVHSRLLFQGGNLLAVRDPKTRERILLIGEGEIHRNAALGLTKEQAIEAFRAEFGADRCVMLPAVSYHFDFDVTVRAHEDGLTAFVNDTDAAVREITKGGIGALGRSGFLSASAAAEAHGHLTARRDGALLQQLGEALLKARANHNDLPATFANCFVADNSDSAAGNLQVFLLALDLLESSLPQSEASNGDADRVEYLHALRRMQERSEEQIQQLRSLGWKVVAIPSMTDLFRSINYLNGIHYRDGYLMPMFAGFYRSLDQLAAAKFQGTMGRGVRIQGIRNAECQRRHGGVHCTISAYPKL